MRILDDTITRDVVVVGGGPAGVTTATAAARMGADTLLLEAYGFLGGAATLYGVTSFCPFTAEGGEPVVTQGIGLEILKKLHDAGGTGYHYGAFENYYNWVPIDPEIYKVVLDRLVGEAGATVWYRTPFIDVEMADGRIDCLLVYTLRGLMRVRAKVYVDCSGDGEVMDRAGVAYEVGDEDGACMAPTMCFRMGNCSFTRFRQYLKESGDAPYLPDAVCRARAAGDFDTPESRAGGVMFYNETECAFNAGHVFNVDPLDVGDMSRAETEGRAYVQEWQRFLRAYVPGFEECTLVSTGPLVGKRESRRMVGRDRLTLDDYLGPNTSDQDIAGNAYYLDVHPSDLKKNREGKRAQFKKLVREELRDDIKRLPKGKAYGIRYGCMLPQDGPGNLIVSGRPISVDRLVHSSARVMPCCFALGHAAGVAAAQCVKGGFDPPAADVAAIRAALLEQGAYLPG